MSIQIANFEIRFDQDVVNTRQQARLIAEMLGYSGKDQTGISTAISEIARNCIQYAQGGVAEFSIGGLMPNQWLCMIVRDHGPGIDNLDDILDGRYYSPTGLGKGILGSRRLLPSHFQIETSSGQGTSVTLGKILPTFIQPISNATLKKISDTLSGFRAEMPLEQIRQQSETVLQAARATQQTMLEGILDGYLRIDSQGILLDVNPAYIEQSGYARDELLGMCITDLEAGKCVGETTRRLKQVEEIGAAHFESEHRRKDGSVWFADVSINHLEILGGEYFVFLCDISERKKDESELRISAIAFETPEGIIITDVNETIIRVNRAFTRITGYLPKEVIGKTPSMMKSGCHDQAFYDDLHIALQQNGSWEGEIWDRHKDGHIYPKWLGITAVYDETGQITHYVANFTDISERKAYEEKIKNLAYYDTLTALANRRLLTERMEHALERSVRTSHHCAVLFLDLDNFKLLNDTQGHGAGDELLVEVARRLKGCVRKSDTVARLGGDEFVVLLEELHPDVDSAAVQVSSVAEKIVSSLAEPYSLNHGIHNCSSSMGIVLMTGSDITTDSVLAQADTAMYAAKKSGKNTFRFFDPAMQEELAQRTTLESALRRAIKESQFSLYYQPQVDEQGHLLGVEALIRWHHPDLGLVPPVQFIPLAEETDIILSIGRWVLETACAQLKTWKVISSTQNLTIAVNVSAKQFYQPNFVDEVKEIITYYDIEPSQLKLELTESMVLKKVETTIGKMLSLKALGITLSMDDFGTGYSSLSYLRILPFDQIKIDKSFIEGILENRTDAFIVSSVLQLGQLIGINVIAEGVETSQQFDLLRSLGCTGFQGYLFGKPVPVNDIENRLFQYC
jgi:diguanylate cyclase (GGDEF)-like protein/PAS domain S-box-containing protein